MMKRTNFNRVFGAAVLAGLIVLPASAFAAGSTMRAKFVYDAVADCESPAVSNFPVHAEGVGTLTVDRHASLDIDSSVAGREHYETTLGGRPSEAAGGSASLRVLGKHRIQAVRSYPNNILIADINVVGSGCTLTVVNKLKPGKRLYTFTSSSGAMAYCGRARVVSTSCQPL
jgi:hypothetical protein